MRRLPSAPAQTKYHARAVCACGHPRDFHALWPRAASAVVELESHCLDVYCPCRRYEHKYDSMAEAARGAELELLERAGQIRDVTRQVRIPLLVGERRTNVGEYVADFVYEDVLTGVKTYEDVKGRRTPVYQLKRKLVRAIWGIEIHEVNV